MKQLHRHLYKHIFFGIAIVMVLVDVLFVVFKTIQESADLSQAGFSTPGIILHEILHLPLFNSHTWPAQAALGTLMGLSYMAQNNEILIYQTVGYSKAKLMRLTAYASLIIALIGFLFIGFLAPLSNQANQVLYKQQTRQNTQPTSASSLWLKRPNQLIYIQRNLGETLQGITLYQMDPKAGITRTIQAQSATQHGNTWRLHHVQIIRYNAAPHITHQRQLTMTLPTLPETLNNSPNQLSPFALHRIIQLRRQNGLNTAYYRLRLWQSIMLPISAALIMTFMVPFIFGEQRSYKLLLQLVFGLCVGLVFYFFIQFFAPFSLVLGLPPWLGAILPTATMIIFLGGASFALA